MSGEVAPRSNNDHTLRQGSRLRPRGNHLNTIFDEHDYSLIHNFLRWKLEVAEIVLRVCYSHGIRRTDEVLYNIWDNLKYWHIPVFERYPRRFSEEALRLRQAINGNPYYPALKHDLSREEVESIPLADLSWPDQRHPLLRRVKPGEVPLTIPPPGRVNRELTSKAIAIVDEDWKLRRARGRGQSPS